MLIDVDTKQPITEVPHSKNWKLIVGRLSVDELAEAQAAINRLVDAEGRIFTAGWLPGSDWRGTPFQPIYEKAARHDYELSALLYGLLVYVTVMQRDDTWSSGRYKVRDRDIRSRTYFKVTV